MIGNRNAMPTRTVALNDDVTSDLMDLAVPEVPTQQFRKRGAADVTRQLHATAKTSSRTRCSRILFGFG